MNDPGCSGPLDSSEYNPPPPACSNGRDDDGDGLVDLKDPGCSSPQDDDERNSAPPPPPPPPPPPGGGKGHLPSELFGIAEGGAADSRDYAQMERINVQSLRVSLFWRRVRAEPWALRVARPIRRLACVVRDPTHVHVFSTPQWATGSSNASVPPPNHRASRAWKKFLKHAVRRYGPHGSFWKENPGATEDAGSVVADLE